MTKGFTNAMAFILKVDPTALIDIADIFSPTHFTN
jgi:hypothetical protein